MQQQIRQALLALPLPVNRLEEFDNCREAWRKCQAWLKDIEGARLQHNQAYTETMLNEYADFSVRLNLHRLIRRRLGQSLMANILC